jgi:hypothetical protein
MRFDRDLRLQRTLDYGYLLRSYSASQSPTIRLDQLSQSVGNLGTRLVAGEDDFGNPGATHSIGIDANEWQEHFSRFVLLLLPKAKSLTKINKR